MCFRVRHMISLGRPGRNMISCELEEDGVTPKAKGGFSQAASPYYAAVTSDSPLQWTYTSAKNLPSCAAGSTCFAGTAGNGAL